MPRGREMTTVDGHEFVAWEPAEPLSDEYRELVEILELQRRGMDPKTQRSLDDRLKRIEGDLVPVCECGWRGLPDDWMPAGSRSSRGGNQHNTHQLNARMESAQREFAAEMAAAALRHAAEDWDRDEDVAAWLRRRAERVLSVGSYDGERWP